METPQLIPIELIDPNPYQPRQAEDPQTVADIAASIQRNGLAQIPSARQVGDRYQLAFGHTRLAAFKRNGETHMPLFIRDFDDQQMFELGVAENVRRKDLNPIELARAMKVYMEQFNKTSRECGEFFDGASPEKVRSTVRLLNLPKDLQAGVADGTITQNNARRLLTIQRVAPDKLKSVASKLGHSDVDPDRVIGETLKDRTNAVEMWQRWQDGDPRAGSHLWKIYMPGEKFPNNLLPELKAGEVAKALEIDKDPELERYIGMLRDDCFPGFDGIREYVPRETTAAEYLISKGASTDLIEKISHLLNPPGCSVCPFYAKVDGSHYCTLKLCHSRKTHAWEEYVIQSASKKLGIKVYDPKVDGKAREDLSSWHDPDKKLFAARHADLRLVAVAASSYQNFEGLPDGVKLIVVGKTVNARLAKITKRVDDNASYQVEQRRLAKIREANRMAVYEFIWHVATPALLPVFNGSTALGFINSLSDRFCSGVPAEEPDPKKATKKERLEFYQRAILFSLLDDDLWEFITGEQTKPVRSLAKHLQGIAKTWGVELPKDWMTRATEADKAITVTTETAEEK